MVEEVPTVVEDLTGLGWLPSRDFEGLGIQGLGFGI